MKQRNQDKNTKGKTKNTKCVRPKKQTNLYSNEVRKHKHEKNKTKLWGRCANRWTNLP